MNLVAELDRALARAGLDASPDVDEDTADELIKLRCKALDAVLVVLQGTSDIPERIRKAELEAVWSEAHVQAARVRELEAKLRAVRELMEKHSFITTASGEHVASVNPAHLYRVLEGS